MGGAPLPPSCHSNGFGYVQVYQLAKARTDKGTAMNLAKWEAQHTKKIESKLQELGYSD